MECETRYPAAEIGNLRSAATGSLYARRCHIHAPSYSIFLLRRAYSGATRARFPSLNLDVKPVERQDGLISADCGIMRLAAASGAPTLDMFSVIGPAKYAPYGGTNATLDTHAMDGFAAATAAAR